MKTNIHFWSYFAQIFLEGKMFHTIFVQKIETHVLCSVFFFNRAVYEIIWKNDVEQGTPQVTTWHIHIACWIPKATNTHTSCVLIIAFPLRWRLRECTSKLHYTYIAFLFLSKISSGDFGSQNIFMQIRTYVCAKPVRVSTLKMSLFTLPICPVSLANRCSVQSWCLKLLKVIQLKKPVNSQVMTLEMGLAE
jgi:hypothetical protein